MIIGLTGPTGAGKGTVADIFAQNGFAVLDMDRIAHAIYADGTACVQEVEAAFPGVTENGVLNRKALASIVFSDGKKLELLNQITHKYIIAHTRAQLEQLSGQPVVLDAPLLFEAGMDALCDVTVCVVADDTLRKQRIMARDMLSADEAAARMQSQHSSGWFASQCTYCIENNGLPKALNDRVQAVIKQILEEA